jgi:lysine-N-methylase
MSARPLPVRPRLADHVLVRRHVVGGEALVVLHDVTSGATARIGVREWGLLAAADGTRDLDGIVLAAARDGAHARAGALRAFLDDLAAAGMLAGEDEPLAPPAGAPTADELEIPADRPLDPLPGFALTCDGRGSCCRSYATVVFSPLEAARARALAPEVLDAGDVAERAFTPERGAWSPGLAVASIDGRCAYLGDDGRCRVHAAGGAEAKPLGCRVYPSRFIDDGETIRVSVAVECACVLASVGRDGGAPLVPPGARTRGDLDPCIHLTSLAEAFAVADGVVATRAELVAFSRALVAAAPPDDMLAALWALADAIAASGLVRGDGSAWRWPAAPPPAEGALVPLVEALAEAAGRRAREDAGWRGTRAFGGRAVRLVHAAARALLEPGALGSVLVAPPAHAASEAFYARASLHGHELVGALPLADALRDRAVRLLVARALPRALDAIGDDGSDPAFGHPLALVEATLRGQGLTSYFPGS